MVAIIKTGSSLRNVLHYNENKLTQQAAKLIHSMNFGKDTEALGFTDKIRTLQKLAEQNERTLRHAVHISLNFDVTDTLEKEKLQKIAEVYMQKIGFGAQPYLVYEHTDAGHPHIHIVTTNIQSDGRRIQMQNIGRNQSEKARKEIENDFKLVHAQRQQLKQVYELKPVTAQKVQYGKTQTKRAITNVLDTILPTYKYASLPELNAVLKQYNIMADRGSENSRTFLNNGLVYRVLDERGQKIGAPIKASAIYNKPGLPFLTDKFKQNEPLKQPHKLRIRNAIDFALIKKQGQSLEALIKNLEQEKIQVVLRQNDNGVIYGITYIDHQSKCVFNGSDLGKQYSANQIQERCRQKQTQQPAQAENLKPELKPSPFLKPAAAIQADIGAPEQMQPERSILNQLIKPEYEGSLPYELRQDQVRRRKRKRLEQ
jgi:hypothetical protein